MAWLRAHDPGYAALRRAGRAAIVMPSMFALGELVIDNPTLATFAAFGSFAMVLLVDFAGPMRDRLRAQATLAVACALLIALATLVSRSTVLATIGMGLVAFGVLFAGVVSSVLASAATTLLLAFILPVTLAGPASSIPDRVAGWGMAAVASLFAIALLWPAPVRNPLRSAAIGACRALAGRLRADIAFMRGEQSADQRDAAVARADAAMAALQTTFFATPYRPTGLSTSARSVVRLVDELRWLDGIVAHGRPPADRRTMAAHLRARAVKLAAADVLDAGAHLLDDDSRSAEPLHASMAALRVALAELEVGAIRDVPAPDGRGGDAVTALDPSFRAQEMSYVVAQIAANVDLAAAADGRNWLARLLGSRPRGLSGPLAAAQERAGAHVERHSVWLRNSVRGAVGLAAAVLVAKLTGVQHAFWVVFGTLAVLRSNALNTGQNVVRGLIGTAAGFFIGGAIISVIGTDTTLLWVLLPFAVLVAGLAPATISFAAGQAGFTLVLLILFNILAPAGLQIGVVRIEDVAIGSAVSLVVGLLFWPRGAAAALGDALAAAYAGSAHYLAGAVAFGMGRCDATTTKPPAPTTAAVEAAAASRRLDDTFRTFLAERGTKPAALAEMTSLVTGAAGLRLAADAVLELWQGDDPAGGDRAVARGALLQSSRAMTDWYDGFAASLAGRAPVPEPLATDGAADTRLVEAVGHDLRGADGEATATAVRMIWTGDHLDAARRLQRTLVAPARAAGR